MRKVYFLCLLLLVIVFACSQIQSTSNSMEELIAQVPVVSDSANVCNLEKEEAYKKGYSTWKDSTEIRYYIEYRGIYKDGKTITDYFNNSDKKYIEDKTTNAANQWAFAIQKPTLIKVWLYLILNLLWIITIIRIKHFIIWAVLICIIIGLHRQ